MYQEKDCCPPHECRGPKDLPEKWRRLHSILKALRAPTRWRIVEFIGDGEKRTEEIHRFLLEQGESVARSALYYHLSELKAADIIEIAGYFEEGGGATGKIWKLKTKRIEVDLLGE